MKADPDVKMISAEAPILFAKGCDIFITELTMRAWIHAEDNKRRTLQRSDIAAALSKSDMFDFLIDIVPREEATSHAKRSSQAAAPGPSAAPGQMPPSQHSVQPHMGPADYAPLGQHPMPQDQEYRPQPGMYPGAVQTDPTAAYGQPQSQMFEGMYAYPHLPPQQVCHALLHYIILQTLIVHSEGCHSTVRLVISRIIGKEVLLCAGCVLRRTLGFMIDCSYLCFFSPTHLRSRLRQTTGVRAQACI